MVRKTASAGDGKTVSLDSPEPRGVDGIVQSCLSSCGETREILGVVFRVWGGQDGRGNLRNQGVPLLAQTYTPYHLWYLSGDSMAS